MPVVPSNCTKCHRETLVNPANDAEICPLCGEPFIVEKAIDNYEAAIKARESGTADTPIGHADALRRAGKFREAGKAYDRALEQSPFDHRAHWGKMLSGIACAETADVCGDKSLDRLFDQYFSRISILAVTEEEISARLLSALDPEYKNAVQFAPDDIKRAYREFFDRLKSGMKQNIEQRQYNESANPAAQSQYKKHVTLKELVPRIIGSVIVIAAVIGFLYAFFATEIIRDIYDGGTSVVSWMVPFVMIALFSLALGVVSAIFRIEFTPRITTVLGAVLGFVLTVWMEGNPLFKWTVTLTLNVFLGYAAGWPGYICKRKKEAKID